MNAQAFPQAAGPSSGATLDMPAFAMQWLQQQASLNQHMRQAVVVLATLPTERFMPIALWPADAEPSSTLIASAELALAEGRGVLNRSDKTLAQLAVPLIIDEVVRGVVALELDASASTARLAMRQLEWGAAALRERLTQERYREAIARATRADTTLDSLAATLEQDRFAAAAQAAVGELAVRLSCERVSIGFLEKDRCQVVAISHTAGFGRKLELTQALSAAMEEAIEQRISVLFPPGAGDDAVLRRSHDHLAQRSSGVILTVPFAVKGVIIGALLAERTPDRPFDQTAVDDLGAAAALLGPILDAKRTNDLPLVRKLVDAWNEQRLRLLGPRYPGRKLAAIATMLTLFLGLVVTAPYRVVADARIEGLIQRAVVAPYDGFIHSASARAGDVVDKNQELAQLDDRDLGLERLNRITERQQRQLTYDRALSEHDRVAAGLAQAQMDESRSQIGLLDSLIERSKLLAPFRGVVVSGDLSRSIGGTIRRGDILFQVAPLDAYRVVLSIDESQIADIEVGQEGHLLTTSLPSSPLSFRVDRITPVAEAREGRTVFRVEAALKQIPAQLRPGMEGIAKVEVERRRVAWIWTRTFVDWLRLKLWGWW